MLIISYGYVDGKFFLPYLHQLVVRSPPATELLENLGRGGVNKAPTLPHVRRLIVANGRESRTIAVRGERLKRRFSTTFSLHWRIALLNSKLTADAAATPRRSWNSKIAVVIASGRPSVPAEAPATRSVTIFA